MTRVTIMLLNFQSQKDMTCWEMRYTTGDFQSLSVQQGGPVLAGYRSVRSLHITVF